MPPDGFNCGLVTPPPTSPPVQLWPAQSRTELIVDTWRVMLADPEGNLIGLPGPTPLQAVVYAGRAQTRAL